MKRTLLLSLAILAVAGLAQSATVNLVSNGSFEQGAGGIGSFTGWQTTLRDSATFVDSSGQTGTHAGQADDGLWSAYFGSTASSGGSSISQTLTTDVNQMYALSFYVANDNGGQPANNSFVTSIGGRTESLSNLPSQNYSHEGFVFTASSTQTVLSFLGYNDGGYLQLDNVSVTAVPEPSGAMLMIAGSVVLIGFLAIGRKRSGLTTERES